MQWEISQLPGLSLFWGTVTFLGLYTLQNTSTPEHLS